MNRGTASANGGSGDLKGHGLISKYLAQLGERVHLPKTKLPAEPSDHDCLAAQPKSLNTQP
jgi:hypothetical protein